MLASKEYKDSGIVWLGHIPAHWDVTNYRRLFCRRKEYDDNPDKQVLSLTIEGVKRKNENFGKMAEDFTGHQIVRKDDLVFTPRDFDATPILSGIAPCDGCISNLYFVLYPRTPDIDVNFYNYFMWGVKWGGDIWKKLSYGMRFSYNYDQFCALPAIKIPLSEQKVIADYLDNECARIDNIVEKQRNIIEKLKEYKKSVITEAVTRGLNPTVPMKDSGIEWIGKIPEQWQIKKLKYVLYQRNEKISDVSLKYIGLENIISFSNKYMNTNNISEPSSMNNICKKGDILFGKLRPYLAKCIISDFDGMCSGEFLVLYNCRGIVSYYHYLLLSHWFLDMVNSSTYGTKMPRANWDFIGSMFLPEPNIKEQRAIADYLDQKCAEIDSVVEKRERMIDLLAEYKKSLIYECVTGKKEVA